jgi:DNA modification methylase
MALLSGYQPPQRTVKAGQVWGLGPHRLMCGSSINPHHLEHLFNGEKARASFTSPPYCDLRMYDDTWDNDFNGLMKPLCSMIADHMTEDHQLLFNIGTKIIDQCVYEYWDEWKRWMIKENGYRLYAINIWDKLNPTPACNHRLYRTSEFIYHFNRVKRMPHYTVQKKPESIKYQNDFYDGRMRANGRRSKQCRNHGRSHPTMRLADDVFRVPKDGNPRIRSEHPAIFPVKLAEEVLAIWSDPGDVVFEPFCGSGSSIHAADNIGRRALAMECVPRYVEIALLSWEAETGTKPVLLY